MAKVTEKMASCQRYCCLQEVTSELEIPTVTSCGSLLSWTLECLWSRAPISCTGHAWEVISPSLEQAKFLMFFMVSPKVSVGKPRAQTPNFLILWVILLLTVT